MKMEFVQEIDERKPERYPDCLTGWEVIVFQVEDDPEPSPDAQKIGFVAS